MAAESERAARFITFFTQRNVERLHHMGRFTRRNLLKRVAATAIFAPRVFSGDAAMAQLPTLPNLPSTDALLLRPGDAQFADYQKSFNADLPLTQECADQEWQEQG